MIDAILSATAPNRPQTMRALPLGGGAVAQGTLLMGVLALGALAGFVAMRRLGQRRAPARTPVTDDLFIKRLRQSGEF